ncbi:restriction endonuclease subunit S [Tenacibaculum finnmarkense]|uniref:restriction endonuclease subunit S n=1 Tax=Tenacibaculum finnmarkense TaxID=2781243 RepID=UPI001EFBB7D4|nr:restriction endonuclease subunit S [Tenacibaculum finnmarkense]MCG8859977.1 hypothetical protein [Tenacibaculum finnmarkense]
MNQEIQKIGKEWLGNLPKHWKIDRIKDVCEKITGGGTPKSSISEYWEDGEITWISPTDFGKQKGNKYITTSEKKITELGVKKSSATFLPEGTVIMSSRASIGEPKIAGKIITTNQGFISYITNHKLLNNYLFYCIECQLGDYFLDIATGTTFMEISRRMASIEYIPLPSPREQKAIAEYLDKATTKIDHIIAIKKEQLVKMEENTQSLISEFVTGKKTLEDCNIYKSSNIEWLGEMPKHWEIKRLFNICDFVRGNSAFKKNELLNKGKYVALQYGKTYKVEEVNEQFQFYVNDNFYKSSQIVNYGDVIFVSTSETMEDLGHSVFYSRNDIGLIGGEQILLKPNKNILDGKYLFYTTKVFGKELNKFATGLKVFRFDVYDLKTIYIPIPSVKEQKAIAQHLDKSIAKIKKVENIILSQIETLKDYRKSLIHECVTGKKQLASDIKNQAYA